MLKIALVQVEGGDRKGEQGEGGGETARAVLPGPRQEDQQTAERPQGGVYHHSGACLCVCEYSYIYLKKCILICS